MVKSKLAPAVSDAAAEFINHCSSSWSASQRLILSAWLFIKDPDNLLVVAILVKNGLPLLSPDVAVNRNIE